MSSSFVPKGSQFNNAKQSKPLIISRYWEIRFLKVLLIRTKAKQTFQIGGLCYLSSSPPTRCFLADILHFAPFSFALKTVFLQRLISKLNQDERRLFFVAFFH